MDVGCIAGSFIFQVDFYIDIHQLESSAKEERGWSTAYKGAMAYFRVLDHGGDKAGVTVHWIHTRHKEGEEIK
ncbi:MAG: hypothetical protein GY784_17485 [Gammaproteobacteria bacterium]|nr:hypothetical protein [Gammaproteobacteria bacterium]